MSKILELNEIRTVPEGIEVEHTSKIEHGLHLNPESEEGVSLITPQHRLITLEFLLCFPFFSFQILNVGLVSGWISGLKAIVLTSQTAVSGLGCPEGFLLRMMGGLDLKCAEEHVTSLDPKVYKFSLKQPSSSCSGFKNSHSTVRLENMKSCSVIHPCFIQNTIEGIQKLL